MPLKMAVCLGIIGLATSPLLAGFTPFQICPEHTASQISYAVEGHVVFWEELTLSGTYVYGKDLSTGQIYSVGGSLPSQNAPSISGDMVAWESNHNGNWDIYATNYRTGQQWSVCLNTANQTAPAISGNYVVWQDSRNSLPSPFATTNIYGMDLRTGHEFSLGAGDEITPDISGNTVVWTEYSVSGSDIWGYDLQKQQQFRIVDGPLPTMGPAGGDKISGDLVVWVGNGNICGEYLSQGTPFIIPTHAGPNGRTNPDVDGRWVVWTYYASGTDTDIYAYDLLTGREFPVYVGPGRQDNAYVSGNLVVWTSYLTGQPKKVYGAYLPEPASAGLLLAGGLAALRRRIPAMRR